MSVTMVAYLGIDVMGRGMVPSRARKGNEVTAGNRTPEPA